MDKIIDIEIPQAPPEGETTPPATLSERKAQFLELVRDHGTTDAAAAAAVGVDRVTVWRWKKGDAEFAKAYNADRKVGLEHLVKEAERRAINGSDRLLMFLLEHYNPEVFGRREELNLGNAGGKPLQVTDHTVATRVADLLALAAARRQAEEDEARSLV
jgi:hypothetical protein